MSDAPSGPEKGGQTQATGMVGRVVGVYRRGTNFFTDKIWEQRVDDLPTGRAWGYQTARVVYCTLHGLIVGDRLQVRAAALTYFTVLSLVPLLAFAFALLKGFGAYDVLVEETLRPYLHQFLSGNESLQTALDQILGFVDNTGVTSLGFVGLVTLLYAATRLLRNVELALNEIWSVRGARETVQQLRDYVAIIVVTPICLMAGAGLTTAGQAFSLLQAAGESLGISELLDQLIGVMGPLVVLFLGLLFLYKVMPYTNVRFLSAVTGAAVGAVLWYIVLIIHVRFQVGVAQYNALYSSFGAIPIFLAWLQVSWLVVLAGAQIASTHQNSAGLAQRKRLANADQALKEAIALAALLRIGRAFVACEGAVSRRVMSAEFSVPEPLLTELFDQLVKAQLLVEAGLPSDPNYVLARPPELVHVKDVLDALRRNQGTPAEAFAGHAHIGTKAAELWHALDDSLTGSQANRTLHDVLSEESEQPKAQHGSGEPRLDDHGITPRRDPLPAE
jgi:membrane protein